MGPASSTSWPPEWTGLLGPAAGLDDPRLSRPCPPLELHRGIVPDVARAAHPADHADVGHQPPEPFARSVACSGG
jgi:hypothetical protein